MLDAKEGEDDVEDVEDVGNESNQQERKKRKYNYGAKTALFPLSRVGFKHLPIPSSRVFT